MGCSRWLSCLPVWVGKEAVNTHKSHDHPARVPHTFVWRMPAFMARHQTENRLAPMGEADVVDADCGLRCNSRSGCRVLSMMTN
jgi:hypothetical protein